MGNVVSNPRGHLFLSSRVGPGPNTKVVPLASVIKGGTHVPMTHLMPCLVPKERALLLYGCFGFVLQAT